MNLDEELLKAHEKGDGKTLARLYAKAAEEATGEQAAFYLTHAYVYALEEGMEEAQTYHKKLKAWGSEE